MLRETATAGANRKAEVTIPRRILIGSDTDAAAVPCDGLAGH
jgi:hypothetical protein